MFSPISIFLFFVAIAALFYAVLQRQRGRRIERDRLRFLSNQISLAEDRQRRELASAIHDGLAQQLFGIRAQMVLLK